MYLCPNDQTELVSFKDQFFPRDIIMERCAVCDGFWLNRGDFSEYQEGCRDLQKAKVGKTQSSEINPDVMKVMETYSDRDTTEALGRLGAFLSTPNRQAYASPL
jgi:Zn-finger nucleic acid-binding protein